MSAQKARGRRPRRAAKSGAAAKEQLGVALLMVVACLAILMPFTASFGYRARVDYQSAINARDQVAARHLQRGGLKLSLLLFELQRMVFNQKQFAEMLGRFDITQVAPYLMGIFGTADGAEGLGAMVGMDTSFLSDLGAKGGEFEVRVEAESGKINVNCLADQEKKGASPGATVALMIDEMFRPTLYDPMFDQEQPDGEIYYRARVLQRLVDYIDDDRRRFDDVRLYSHGREEADNYAKLAFPYQARNARLDSIEELNLVEGIGDDWMKAFSDRMTVYGSCKVNLNFASADQIAQVIARTVNREKDGDKVAGDNYLTRVLPLANFVVEQREFRLFTKLEDFKEMVKQPDQFLTPLNFLGGEEEQDLDPLGQVIPEGLEVEVSVNKKGDEAEAAVGLKDIATVDPERVYRLEVITSVGAVRKRATAVYDMNYARAQSKGKGAWLYFRED